MPRKPDYWENLCKTDCKYHDFAVPFCIDWTDDNEPIFAWLLLCRKFGFVFDWFSGFRLTACNKHYVSGISPGLEFGSLPGHNSMQNTMSVRIHGVMAEG